MPRVTDYTSAASNSSLKMTMIRTVKPTQAWSRAASLAGQGALVVLSLILIAGTDRVSAAGQAQSERLHSNPASQSHTYDGVVTDTHCSAKHSTSIGDTAGDCTIRCVRGGEQFALVDGELIYILEGDPVILKQAAGQRVRVSGTLNQQRIAVTSITAP